MDFAYQGTLYLLGVSLTFIVSFILFRSAAGNPRINRLLGVAFFCMAWYNMIYYLTVTNQIVRFYWILGWGTPQYYLITPCIFLYVRQTLNGKKGITRKDWIHFLPAAITLLDYLPFCLGLVGSKLAYARASQSNHNQFYLQRISLLPGLVHYIIRPLQALTYLFFQWKMVIGAYRGRKVLGRVYRWLVLLTVMVTTFYVVLSVLTITGLMEGNGLYVVMNYKYLILMLDSCLMLVSMGLLFYPEALYGIPHLAARELTLSAGPASTSEPASAPDPWGPLAYPTTIHGQLALIGPGAAAEPEPSLQSTEPLQEVPLEDEEKESRSKIPKEEDLNILIQTIEQHLNTQRPYLQPKWSIQEMAVATHIPLHQLSFAINHHYKVRYTELMNRYRVNHAKELIAAGAWKELSLEGLAKQSGFSNRTNFFLVFKKFTGLSPSEYLQQVKSSS